MKWNQIVEKLQRIGKDRFLLLFLAGLMLIVIAMPMEKKESTDTERSSGMSVPEGDSQETSAAAEEILWENDAEIYRRQLCLQLKEFLQKIDGVGQTEVYITMHSSSEIIVERNSPYTRRSEEEVEGGNTRTVGETENGSEVVLMQQQDGSQSPIVVKEIVPVVKGVVIAAQGADNIKVKNEIVQLVMALFGIEEHKIRVVKRTV